MANTLNPVAQQLLQTFTRLPVPTEHQALQPVITDIYNKIAATQGVTQTVQSQIPTTQQITAIAQSTAVAASAAAVPTSINGLIPVVLTNLNTTPLTDRNGKTVAAVDQAVVYWNIQGSDSGVLYQYTNTGGIATNWNYISGMVARTQSQLAALAALLGPADTGLLVDVTDYAHILKWTGSAWTYADPTDPAGRIEMFLVDPSPVTGWQLCDGTAAVKYLKADGTTGTQTMPDLVSVAANAAYAKLGSPATGNPVAAVAPNFTGTAQTFTTSPAQATGTVNAFTAPNPYTPAGTVDATGEPRFIVLRPWFRT